ncbi:MAG: GAF domain-containing protein [Nanobdellota archaeon]
MMKKLKRLRERLENDEEKINILKSLFPDISKLKNVHETLRYFLEMFSEYGSDDPRIYLYDKENKFVTHRAYFHKGPVIEEGRFDRPSQHGMSLKSNNREYGFLFLEDKVMKRFRNLKGKISDIIYMSLLLTRLQKRVEDITSISEISKEMVTYDLNSLLKLILDTALERINAISGSIMLLEDDVLQVKYAKGSGIRKNFSEIKFRMGEGAAGTVAESAEMVLIENKLKDERYIDVGSRTYTKNSYIGFPLLFKGKVLGVLNVDFKSSREISDDCIQFLEILASNASIAIRNTQLYNEHIKRVKRLSAVYDVTKKISATLDLEEVLDVIVVKIIKMVNASSCSVLLLDKTKTRLVPKSIYNLSGRHLHSKTIGLDDTLSGKAVSSKDMVYRRDILQDPEYGDKDYARKKGFRSFLSIPLVIENHGIGVINIYTKDERTFSNNELQMLSSFADQVAIAIEKAILYRHIKNDKEKLSKVLEISNELSATLDFDRLLHITLKRCVELTGAKGGALLVKEDDWLKIHEAIGYSKNKKETKVKIGQGITGWVAENAEPLFVGDVSKDDRYYKVLPREKSEAALPIRIKGKVFGVLNLDSNEKNKFEKHRETLEILMDRISMAIENSWLHKESKNFNKKLKEEVRAATKSLLKANRRLIKMDKLKTDFVSNVSHELRTPLTSIIGYSKLLKSEKIGSLNETQKDSLNTIIDESERLTRLINDLLDLSKLERGKMSLNLTEVDINSLIDHALSVMKPQGTELEFCVEKGSLPKIYADKDKLSQVINNLLSNAIKFTKEGGTITIRTKDARTHVKVSVTDTGKGIKKENIPKLFDKFYQVDPSLTKISSGTGLGLPIAQHIVKMHGGSMDVDSEPGKGTKFTFSVSKKLKKVRE